MKRIDISTPKYPDTFALVDDDDYDSLSVFRWRAFGSRPPLYVSRATYSRGKDRTVLMHRQILGCKGMIDHKDGDGLNNQRSNLRGCTPSQNLQNQKQARRGSSAYKGVHWHISNKKWEAGIGLNGKNIYLGRYASEVEAAIAYDKAAAELFGEFAALNFEPEKVSQPPRVFGTSADMKS